MLQWAVHIQLKSPAFTCVIQYHREDHSFHHLSKELLPRGKTGRTWLLMLQEKVYFHRKTFLSFSWSVWEHLCVGLFNVGHSNILTTWQSIQFRGGVRVTVTLDSHFPGLQKAVSYVWHLTSQHRGEAAASPLKCVSCGCPTRGYKVGTAEGVSQESPGGFASCHMGSSSPGHVHTPWHWGNLGVNGRAPSLPIGARRSETKFSKWILVELSWSR